MCHRTVSGSGPLVALIKPRSSSAFTVLRFADAELLGFLLQPAILNSGVKSLSKVRKDTRLAGKWIGAFDH